MFDPFAAMLEISLDLFSILHRNLEESSFVGHPILDGSLWMFSDPIFGYPMIYKSVLTDVYLLRKLPEFLTAKPSEEAKEEVKRQLLQVRTTRFGGSLHWIAPWYIDMIAHDTPWAMGKKHGNLMEFDGK